MKKKILFMLNSMNIGGVEKSFLSLLSVIPKSKYEITLLLLEKKGGYLELVPDWIKVEEVTWYKEVKPIIMQPPQRTINHYIKRREYFWVLIFLFSYIFSEKIFKDRYIYYKNLVKDVPKHDEDFDIAIAYQGPTEIIEYYIANKVEAKRKIAWVHFDVSKHKINKKLYFRLYKKFDNIFAVSKKAKEKLVQEIPGILSKTKVFLNIVSESSIKNMAEDDQYLDDEYEGIRIVTVGRLTEEKGQDLAINVLARLKKAGYKVRWYCIGEGNRRQEYEELIKTNGLTDDFILQGAVQNPYPYIARADIYVQTSRHEGYCLALAEARCLKKPIVTTNFSGVKEQIINGYNGLIADICVEGLFEKIKYLIENPDVGKHLISNLSLVNFRTGNESSDLLLYIEFENEHLHELEKMYQQSII